MPHHRLAPRVLLVAATISAAWTVAVRADTGLEERLQQLVDTLEQRRVEMHVPGMAIVIVKDDEVVLTHGFGVADVETERPVTPETLFAIGSSTKAFTATLIGMLVDEGRMDWDDPVTRYLPYFEPDVDSDDESAEITLRDMLCHRTGFSRMGVLWAAGAVSREEVLRTATRAEPWAKFRAGFHYNNVMYLASGMASAVAAETDWDGLLAERLLGPLGMTSSNTSVRISQTDPRLALGYIWEEENGAFKHLPMRVLDTIAPAGAINSNAVDMAQWLRLQLAGGVHDGRRLVAEERIRETWSPQITVGENVEYGLGWMLREWEGQRVVEHGGNIDGFGATVALLPESSLGFVLLTNVTATPLQGLAPRLVWEAVVGSPETDAAVVGAGGGDDFAPYVGTYVANFATFKNQEFTVLVQNDRLAVDVPGQMVFELEPPDENGKRLFSITDTIAVVFEHDDTGRVIGMRMHQAGYEFDLPRSGVEVVGEIDVAELQKYLGTYHADVPVAMDVEVVVQNNRLAVDVPQQMVFELGPPDEEEGRWPFRIKKELAVSFATGDDGRVASMTMHQPGVEIALTRTASTGVEPAVTLEEILSLRQTDRRREALRDLGVFRVRGRVHLVNAGVEGEATLYGAGTDRFLQASDLGEFGWTLVAANGDAAWSASAFAAFDELHGPYLVQARQSHPGALVADWRDFFDTVEVLPDTRLDGERVHVVRVQGGDAPALTLSIDPATGDVLAVEAITLMPSIGSIPVRTRLGDYREMHGLRLPFRFVVANEASGRSITEITSLETDLRVDDGFFTLTEADADRDRHRGP